MKVRVEAGRCIASGACVLISPEVFQQDEDGIVELVTDRPAAELHELTFDAARACPASVISVDG